MIEDVNNKNQLDKLKMALEKLAQSLKRESTLKEQVERMREDVNRLDWLEKQLDNGGFSADGNQHLRGGPALPQGGDPIELFTVASQHVKGKTLRETVDLAISEALKGGEGK